MTRVVVCGICGRMGTMVAKAISASNDMALAGGVEVADHSCLGMRVRDAPGGADSDALIRADIGAFGPDEYDVIVDFSSPEQVPACAGKAALNGKGLVVGTTGITAAGRAALEKASARSPVVVAPNTSVGVNVLFELAGRAASLLGAECDVEIVEAHHRAKKDAPSGTAARLLAIVAAARGLDPARSAKHGRVGTSGGRGPQEVGVHSIRAGQIVGRHELSFVSDVEELKIAHEALSREAFAAGAVRAARYVHGREPGLYEMADVLGLREPHTKR